MSDNVLHNKKYIDSAKVDKNFKVVIAKDFMPNGGNSRQFEAIENSKLMLSEYDNSLNFEPLVNYQTIKNEVTDNNFDLSEIHDYNFDITEDNMKSNENNSQNPSSGLNCSEIEVKGTYKDTDNKELSSVVKQRKRTPRKMVKPSEHNFTDLNQLEPGNNECHICKKTFKLRNKLLAHFSIHPPQNPEVYDLSKKPSLALVGVDTVLSTPEEIEKKPFACALCPKRFKIWSGLEDHCCVHTGEKPYVCNICSKAYRDRSYIVGHAMLHKGQVAFQCDICKKSFTRKQNLVTHYLTHTGEKPHVCDICHQAFRKKNLMIVHYRLHVNDFPFSCKECGRRFRSKQYLVTHVLTHSVDKPFACDTCPKSFTQNRWLIKHKEFHEGKRKYECHFCFYAFKRKVDLEFHISLHTEERPYVCEICGRRFTKECLLNVHFQTHSKKETASIKTIDSLKISQNVVKKETSFITDNQLFSK